MTYKELYQTLLQNHLVAPIYVPEKKPPYLPWYNPNAHCEYHAGVVGHDIKNHISFKGNMQNLINLKVLQFGMNQGPNVATNPLTNHTKPAVNMINIKNKYEVKASIEDVRMPMFLIWQALIQDRLLNITGKLEDNPDNFCDFHTILGYTRQTCKEFRSMVQRMMNEGQIEFYQETTPATESINMIGMKPPSHFMAEADPLFFMASKVSRSVF